MTVDVDPGEILYDESSFIVEVKVKQEETDDPQSEDVHEFADEITYATEIAVPEVSVQKVKKTIKKEKTERDETRLPVKKRKRRNKGTPRGRPRVHFEMDEREYPRKCDHVSIGHCILCLKYHTYHTHLQEGYHLEVIRGHIERLNCQRIQTL